MSRDDFRGNFQKTGSFSQVVYIQDLESLKITVTKRLRLHGAQSNQEGDRQWECNAAPAIFLVNFVSKLCYL